jgi:probable phosphoglycerate mutase
MYEAQMRIVSGLHKICENHKDQVVAVVSHADLIRSAIAWFTGIPLDMMNRIEISPASVSIIEIYNSSAKLMLLNCCKGNMEKNLPVQ